MTTANQNGMRRTSVPRVSTTKPATSPGSLPAVAVTGSVPGTATDGATATWPEPVWTSTVAAQSPAPPPASVSDTATDRVPPAARLPKVSDEG